MGGPRVFRSLLFRSLLFRSPLLGSPLLGSLLPLVLLVGLLAAGPSRAAAAADDEPRDVVAELQAIPGMRVISETPTEPGYRFFLLGYQQPIDHSRPSRGTFEQRLTLLHRSWSRPMVLHTSGYNVRTTPFRSEPTRIVDGNQISVEERFFTPSRPAEPADWSTLDIRQAAADHHRIVTALKALYRGKWLSTGASKGGMASVYHRRFYPHDVDGTIAYVAPDDVVDGEDSAYDDFFATVGTEPCRGALAAAQREALVRRDEIVDRYRGWAEDEGYTFDVVGGPDRAYENVVLDIVWAFWQYGGTADCAGIPAVTASTDDLYTWIDAVSGFAFYTDQGLAPFTPYYYQAGTQLGSPVYGTSDLAGLLRYPGSYRPRSYVPRDIPMRFSPGAMRDVDSWVRERGSGLLFVYGSDDPWGAEPFRLGPGSRDSAEFVARGANHGADIEALAADERASATADVRRWAGLNTTVFTTFTTGHIAALDSYREALQRRPR